MNNWLINPFKYIAGGKALVWGLSIMLLTALIARFSHTHFDGALDVHVGFDGHWALYLLEPLVDWTCIVIFFYLGSRLAATTRVRLIDLAGTTALSRAPLLLVALAAFLQPGEVSLDNLPPFFWVVALVSVWSAIWMIVLLYHAFTVSANLKGVKAAITFTISLILAEILSKIILHYIYLSFT